MPGAGAGAVVSAAYGLPCPAVDGNVVRVAARLADCPAPPETVRRLAAEALAAAFPVGEAAHIFNQAWMELGAVVCVPNGPPRCGACPLRVLCRGRDHAETLPTRPEKRPRRVEDRTVFVLLCGGAAAVRKRPERGLLAGLWEFPNVSGTLDEAAAAETVRAWGLTPSAWRESLSAKHIFTHVEWHMTGYTLSVREAGGGFRWVDAAELEEVALPSAFARYRRQAAELLGETRKEADV